MNRKVKKVQKRERDRESWRENLRFCDSPLEIISKREWAHWLKPLKICVGWKQNFATIFFGPAYASCKNNCDKNCEMWDKFEGFEIEIVQINFFFRKTFQGQTVIFSALSAELCSLTTAVNKKNLKSFKLSN